jgi:hypothetical protein
VDRTKQNREERNNSEKGRKGRVNEDIFML